MSQKSRPAGSKNPKRVLAGQKNRARRGELSSAGRQQLRAAAVLNRPWGHATGPRTSDGKARSAANGTSRQKRPVSTRQIRRDMAEVRELLAASRETRLRVTSAMESIEVDQTLEDPDHSE